MTELAAGARAAEQPDIKLTMVVTLKNGVQIRIGVKDAEVARSRATGELTELKWTAGDDPFGNSIGYISTSEIAAVHYEREPR